MTPRSRSRAVPVALGLAASLVLSATGCKRPLGEIIGMSQSIAPFERPPYLQAVDTTSAVVRWLASPSATGGLEYRTDEAEWRPAVAERSRDTVSGVMGPAMMRTVRLTGLPPGARVEYRVTAGQRQVGPFTFRTAPRPADSDTVRILAFGDSGWGSEEQLRLAERMLAERVDLAIHTGDIAYQVGSETDFTLRHFQVYADLLARVPFFPSPGNHDLRVDGGAPYDRAFVQDRPYDDGRFYSFRWGDIVFLSIDTTDEDLPEHEDDPFVAEIARVREDGRRESDGSMLRDREGRELEWIADQLRVASADPSVRWILAFMHDPPYSHAQGLSAHGSDVRIQRALSPLFDRFGVDLVLAGHDHHYERTTPILDRRPRAPGCGPVYIVTGGGGASRLARGIAPGPLLEVGTREHHYVRLVLTGRIIRGEAVGVRGQTLDAFEVLPFAGLDEEGDPLDESCDD